MSLDELRDFRLALTALDANDEKERGELLTTIKKTLRKPIILPEGVSPAEHAVRIRNFIRHIGMLFGSRICQEHLVGFDGCFFGMVEHNSEIAIELFEECANCESIYSLHLPAINRWDIVAALYNCDKINVYQLTKIIRCPAQDTPHEIIKKIMPYLDVLLLRAICCDAPDLLEEIEKIDSTSNPLVKGINKII